jgi:inner membrane protein
MNLFPFLQDISPWWWIAFAVALGAIEMATMSFFLIWPGLAALLIAVLLWIAPGLSGTVQVMVFAILSIALTFAGRSLLHRYGDGGEANDTLNSRANLMIGRHAKVLDFHGPEGNVTIDGIRWRARWNLNATAEEGATVEVTGADGMTLLIG